MINFKANDVVTITGTVTRTPKKDETEFYTVRVIRSDGHEMYCRIDSDSLTLVERQIDLATCEFPADDSGIAVMYFGSPAVMVARTNKTAYISQRGYICVCAVDCPDLKPIKSVAAARFVAPPRESIVKTMPNITPKPHWEIERIEDGTAIVRAGDHYSFATFVWQMSNDKACGKPSTLIEDRVKKALAILNTHNWS